MMRAISIRRRLLRLGHSDRGSAAVEFAIITPVFLMLLMGSLDLAHQVYLRSVFNGAVQVAARASGLEEGDTSAADAIVRRIVGPIAPRVAVNISRRSFTSYGDVDAVESFTDSNGNGRCDNGEPFIDLNDDGVRWYAGRSGNGGASDVVEYNVAIIYRSPFALPFLASSMRNSRTMQAVLTGPH